MGGLSFPPVLPQDRWGASTGARPRSKLRGGSLDETTIRQLRDATGHRYPLLQEAIGSGAKRAGEKPNAIASAAQTRASGAFAAVWGDVPQPQFSIFDHCQKRGHAPKSVPAPKLSSLEQWFEEYGRPREEPQPCGQAVSSSLDDTRN